MYVTPSLSKGKRVPAVGWDRQNQLQQPNPVPGGIRNQAEVHQESVQLGANNDGTQLHEKSLSTVSEQTGQEVLVPCNNNSRCQNIHF